MTLDMAEQNKIYKIMKLNLTTPHIQYLAGVGLVGNRPLTIFSNSKGMIVARQNGNKIALSKTLTECIEVKEINEI